LRISRELPDDFSYDQGRLRNINQPIGVAEYQLTESLPEDLQSSLPSIEEIEQALADPAGGAPLP
jgi:hypothetical protein